MNSDALLQQMRFSFANLTLVVVRAKVEVFYKNSLKRSAPKSQCQNPLIWTTKTYFFIIHAKQLEIHYGTKNRLYTPSHQLLRDKAGGEGIRGTNETHTFLLPNFS